MRVLHIFILLTLIFFASCKHPEGKIYERNQGLNIAISNSPDRLRKLNLTSDQSVNEYNENGQNVLRMEEESGVRYVWIEVNGIRLRFIFDTGASSICLSPAEATVLYRQGTLVEDDILNTEYFQDATGKISAGTSINLREVKIGNIVLNNVHALVVDNVEAPLLLGQSVLERIGTIQIDNINKVIVFK
jgi:aspartyl protease family protein